MSVHISKEAQAAAEQAARDMVSTIRQCRVVFFNAKGEEIFSQGDYPCRPGEELTVRVPTPDDVTIS
jgi:hypothetical protein